MKLSIKRRTIRYKIAIEETLHRVVEVEAENPALVVCMAEDEYNRKSTCLRAMILSALISRWFSKTRKLRSI